MKPSPTVNQK